MGRMPFEHALRNAGRRPVRTALTILALGLVTALIVGTSSFVRSLEASHLASAPTRTVILISTSAERDIVRSSMSPSVAAFVAADVPGVLDINGVPAASPEIHMGTDVRVEGFAEPVQAFVRGVTDRAYLVHDQVTLVAGNIPGPGEVMVGVLAATKCGLSDDQLAIGRRVEIEGGSFTISGQFRASGSTTESEIWVGLSELQARSQRDDCSCIFVRTVSDEALLDAELFARRRVDLELECISAATYYRELSSYFDPILRLAWGMAALIALAAMAAGANTMISAVQDRKRELATLRAVGYRGRSLAWNVYQESLLLAGVGAVMGLAAAALFVSKFSISMAMTAFQLRVDPVSLLIGLGGVFVIVSVGTVPALRRVLTQPVAGALRDSS